MSRPELTASMVCAGCGAEAPPEAPFVCPARGEHPDVDHVLRRQLSGAPPSLAAEDDEENPFLRYRELLYAYPFGLARGADADTLSGQVRALDEAIAAVDGRGFRRTPLTHQPELASALELGASLHVKDETENVSGSHKGRHLMEVMSFLRVGALLGAGPSADAPLGIASCGNAALAAAVIARAAGRSLSVFIPTWADPNVVARLRSLGAELVVCERRDGEVGDPTTLRLKEAIAAGTIPFSCQGPDNGLAVVGGLTLGYELVEQLASAAVPLDRVFIQVGGGALASGCTQALIEAHRWGLLQDLPVVHAVQAEGGYPLVRAYDRLVATALQVAPLGDARDTAARAKRAGDLRGQAGASEAASRYARAHRSELMWPWESAPSSIATGILDDETYDWLAVVEGMLVTGGYPVVVSEAELARSRAAVRETTSIVADATGASGLAGALQLRVSGELRSSERVAALLTGHDRTEEGA